MPHETNTQKQQLRQATPAWQKIHEDACSRGELFYRDPETGYIVFTRVKHLARGRCCKSGCRHCPFGFHKDAYP